MALKGFTVSEVRNCSDLDDNSLNIGAKYMPINKRFYKKVEFMK